jgi:hypothetical protein
MTKIHSILMTLTVTLCAMACGYEGADVDIDDTDGTEEPADDKKPPQKDGTGGSAGSPEEKADGGTAGAPETGGGGGTTGDDAGAGKDCTDDCGTGGSTTPDAGTGGSDAGTGGTGGDAGAGGDGGGTPSDSGVTQPAPVVVTGTCSMKFAEAYVGGSNTAEIRGNLPGATWSSGPSITDTNADDYLEFATASIAEGTYELTYMVPPSTWANLGDAAALKAMTPAGREFVSCNWWDPVAKKTVAVSSPSCNLRVTVLSGCKITPAGNMKDFQ